MADGIDGLHIAKADFLDRNRLLLERRANGYQQVVFDDAADTFAIQTITDVTPSLDANKEFQNSGATGYTPSRAMKHVAEIDMAIIESWNLELQRIGAPNPNILDPENAALLRAKLNDPDNRFLRTGGGRI